MDHLPDDIDGMKIYKIKCLSSDIRYLKMHSSQRKGLIGMRKVGRCTVNLYYPYDECPFKLSADEERNRSYYRMLRAIRYASAVNIFLIGNGVGCEK